VTSTTASVRTGAARSITDGRKAAAPTAMGMMASDSQKPTVRA
jgi:hypothetical protein